MNFPGIRKGLSITIQRTVTEDYTFGNHLPDDMEKLLSTPAVASLMIEAAVRLIDPQLPDGFISVGKSCEVVHESPTVVGSTVHVTMTVTDFDGYHITMASEIADESGLCGRGTHMRSIVNKRWLQLKTARKIAGL
jgi:fluoroacetyl-CoA thioesterase